MRRSAINRVSVVLAMVFAITLIWQPALDGEANAQYYTSRADEIYNNSFYSVRVYSDDIQELNHIISVKKNRVLRKDVLEEIAGKANLGIAYNSSLDVLHDRIDMKLEFVTVGTALQKVMAGTGFEPAISKTREIILVKSVSPLEAELLQEFEKELTGRVVDSESGDPLPGVNVFVAGTTVGTSTDSDGRFSLTVPDDAETLIFSFVGYQRLEVSIGDQTEFNVQLQADVAALDDVVVVGYGTQRREDVTGSVSSIGREKLENVPLSSFENAIQGQVAGVDIAETSGEPGASPQVKIRGTGSISAGNDPLYVVDGLPMSKNVDVQGTLARRRGTFKPPAVNPLSTINPNDIESIEVLKDASAAAIYGSRGSNGVVMITTKKGVPGDKPSISFNFSRGFQSAMNVPDMMNSEEVIEYTKDARNNNYLQKYDPLNPASPNFNPNYDPNTNAGRPLTDGNVLIPDKYINWDGTDTDWLDLILSPADQLSSNLGISGGQEDFTYYISGGYFEQGGILEGSGFERFTIKTNLVGDLTDRVQLGLNLNGAFNRFDRLPANAPYFGRPPGIVYSAMVHSPVIKPFNPDGTPNQLDGQSYLGGGTTSASNPIAIMQDTEEEMNNNRLFGTAYIEVDIMDNLTFQSRLGADVDNYERNFFRGNDLLYRTATEPEPFAESSSSLRTNWVWENTVNYSTTFQGDHRITALVGYTAQKENSESKSLIAQNFPDDKVKTVNGGVITGGSEIDEKWSLASILGRVNYSYKDTYLLTASLRTDRSSRFGADNQRGYFPSVSVGWRVTNEDFMDNIDLFSELKLRASYGETGNFLIPNFGSIGLLDQTNYILNDQVVTGVGQSTLGDSELSWETTKSVDVGLDFGVLEDRIYGSVDYYYSRTEDLLLNVTIPSALGFESVLTNIGEVENKGFEISVTSRNLTGGFQWATDVNFAANQNEVLKLGPSGDPILSVGAAGLRHITRIGDEIGSYFGYVVDGIYQSQDEINNAPPDLVAPDPQPGDFRFKDINGDGVIDENDRTVTGSYHPDFTYGITNRFNWKSFDLSVFIQGVVGREILNLTARHMKNGEANFNSYDVLVNRWRSPQNPGNGEHPRADRQSALHGNNNRVSSYQVEDGDYLRIKNVTLGYNVPPSVLGNIARSVRVYATAANLAIFTDYIGFNPESSLPSDGLTPGQDYGAYPLSRTITFGVDISF